MARLGAALLAVVVLWALWWPVAAAIERRATLAWLDDQRAAGWQADAAEVRVSGFPLAYTRRITAPVLADPAGGWAWEGEYIDLTRARHPQMATPGMTLEIPPVQTVRTPWQTLSIAAEQATATLIEGSGGARFERADIELQAIRIVSDTDWDAALDSGTLVAVADAQTPELVRITLGATGFTPPSRVANALSEADLAPRSIERIAAEADVTFDRAWSMAALETERPQLRRIAVRNAGVRWGELTLRVAGTVDVDVDGQASGELLIKATNWRDILAAAVGSGAIPERLAAGAEGALGLMSRLAGSPDTLDIPLTLDDGRARLGPLPLGSIPRLSIP